LIKLANKASAAVHVGYLLLYKSLSVLFARWRHTCRVSPSGLSGP